MLALAMARLTADEAPGATALEFLPMCGVQALGVRAAADPTVRGAFLRELHARADDLRFRVRDAVVDALARIGEATGDALVADVASWMDGYFHAAAVLRALERDAWQGSLHDLCPVYRRHHIKHHGTRAAIVSNLATNYTRCAVFSSTAPMASIAIITARPSAIAWFIR